MQKEKKLLAVLLAAVLCFSLVPVFPARAASDAVMTVESVSATPGSQISIPVTIENNPGILGAEFTLTYDEGLILKNAVSGSAFSMLTMTEPGTFTSPCNFVWDGQDLSSDQVQDGEILVLTFEVSDAAATGTELGVKVSYTPGKIHDADFQPISITVNNGIVTVIDYTPGDVNEDHVVNTIDIILMRRFLAGGYGVTINEEAGDVNDDDVLSTIDIILIRRYLAGGYGVELKAHTTRCTHALEVTAYQAATCTEEGNIAYWYCSSCGKYFDSATATTEIAAEDTVIPATGHTIVVDAAVAATYESTGLTEGSHCSACGEVLVAQEVTDKLERNEYSITYNIAGSDSYLKSISIDNSANPNVYEEGIGVAYLQEPEVEGYIFEGWYDGQGSSANRVTAIATTESRNITLYAKWSLADPYTVIFNYDNTLASVLDVSELKDFTYHVNETKKLPVLSLPGYIFVGWSDEDGNMCDKITSGTTGNKEYYANWLSNRNKASQLKNVGDPYIYEDDELILFTYEIGKIENVPVYNIEDFGYLNSNSVSITKSKEVSVQMSETMVEAYSSAAEKSTTGNATWTLSNGWTDSMTISEEWEKAHDTTVEEERENHLSDADNWYVNTSTGDSHSSTTVDSTDTYDLKTTTNNKTTYGSTDNTESNKDLEESSWNVNGSAEVGGKIAGVVDTKVTVSGGYESKDTEESGSSTTNKTGSDSEEGGGTQTGTVSNHTSTTNDTSTWNNESGVGGSHTTETSEKVAQAISETISNKTGYGETYLKTGTSSESQGLSTTNKNSDTFSSSVTYSKVTYEKETVEYETGAAVTGYHRWVMAATAYVFGSIGYDKVNESYFVTTYTVMDDDFQKYQDYSYKTGAYDDNQTGIIDFCIPDGITDYVCARTFATDGLEFDLDGYVTAYTGEDSAVIIPEYAVIDNQDGKNTLVKVIGIKDGVFENNSSITGVVLSDFITEIPENAFSGCTELWEVYGAGITSIGANAFAGCTKLRSFTLTSDIVSLGDGAFADTEFLEVNAANAEVVQAAVSSGADTIVIGLENLSDSLDGMTLTVPEGTDQFVIRGYGKTFENLYIVSNATTTKINRLNIKITEKKYEEGTRGIPLELNSQNVVLSQLTVNATGICALLNNADTALSLYGTVNLNSSAEHALFCRNTAIKKIKSNLDTKLSTTGNVVTCGTVSGEQYLNITDGKLKTVDATEFEAMLNTCELTFDANGGSEVNSVTVQKGKAVGELQESTWEGYDFDGWFTEKEDGSLVTADTTFRADTTLYAHWTPNTFTVTFEANGGSTPTAEKTVTFSEAYGALPVPTRTGHIFSGWYTLSDGGNIVTEETIVSGREDITLYAHWTLENYTVTFNANSGTVATSSKTVTYSTTFGTLPAASRTGYTFTGWYTAKDGGNKVTDATIYNYASDITLYAHWTPLCYNVTWASATGATIAVTRSSSPNAGATTGTLSSGTAVYYGDVLKVTYSAQTGYSIAKHGATDITVTDNVDSSKIYVTATPNDYTYNIVYISSNGTALGTATEEHAYGTTNTIAAPEKAGYTTPAAQTVVWDSVDAKTITFKYAPADTANTSTGDIILYSEGGSTVYFSCTFEHRNRTANSVEIRLRVKSTLTSGYNYYGHTCSFTAPNGSSIGTNVVSRGDWSSTCGTKYGDSGWLTVPLSTTSATTVKLSYHYWQYNSNGAAYGSEYTGSINVAIPAY